MTIYIAICDDNAADRKQVERLLEREKDARLKLDGDVLYIDSFGSKDALMRTPIKYDMFLIDITESSHNGMDIAKELRLKGIIAPIVLLSSKINYKDFANIPADIIQLDKSITQGQVSHLFDVAKDWAGKKPSLLEIRGKKDTHFIPAREMIRAVEISNHVEVLIEDGTYIEVPESLKAFKRTVNSFNCFIQCKNSIVNISHIDRCEKNTMYLDNGESYEFNPFRIHDILSTTIEYLHSIRQGTNNADA